MGARCNETEGIHSRTWLNFSVLIENTSVITFSFEVFTDSYEFELIVRHNSVWIRHVHFHRRLIWGVCTFIDLLN
jgi:hypothetical protein